AVTAPAWLPTVLVGLVLLTVGFFAAHSGQRLGRPPVGQAARRLARGGGVALPVLLLRGQQHRRHGRRPGVRPPRLDRRRRVRRPATRRGARAGAGAAPRVTRVSRAAAGTRGHWARSAPVG